MSDRRPIPLERPAIDASRANAGGIKTSTANPEDLADLDAAADALRAKLEAKGKGYLWARLNTLDREGMEAMLRRDGPAFRQAREQLHATMQDVNRYARHEQAAWTRAFRRVQRNAGT